MKTEKCSNCGHPATVTRGDYRFDEMGLPLILSHIEIIKCVDCGISEPIIPHMDELIHTLALAVVCSPRKLRPEEVRFLRVYIGLSAKEFARLLHLDNTSVSKMENAEREVGPQTDKLIRFLTINISPELQGKISRLLKMLPDIEDESPAKPSKIRIDPATLQYQYA